MTKRIFKFGKAVIDFLDSKTYSDGSLVSSGFSGEFAVIIDNWQNITAGERTNITNFLAAKGWDFVEDIPE